MDEITYWVYTKRAPCLFKYDYTVKKLNEEAHSSKAKVQNVNHFREPSSPKKKKKKITLLDDESLIEEPNNLCYDTPLKRKPTELKSYKSESEINFNIKDSLTQTKSKKVASKKNGISDNKKKGLVTSTPKVENMLRRSSRTICRNQHNNNQLINSSFTVINSSLDNSKNMLNDSCLPVTEQNMCVDKMNKDIIELASGDNIDNRKLLKTKKETKLNGQFEDLSDVSGLTASYIRSTKLHANNYPRKLQRPTKKLLESQQNLQTPEKKVIVCVNKSMNTELPINGLNCSTDSDNIVNLVTVENNRKTEKVDKSTSTLNFIDPKVKVKNAPKSANKEGKNCYVSFNSKSSGNSRYPTRSKYATAGYNGVTPTRQSPRKSSIKNSNDSDRKENPELCLTRTRSGRNLGLAVRPPDNSVLVISNTELDSSPEIVNVASQKSTLKDTPIHGKKETSASAKCSGKKSMKKTEKSIKDSLREKSGFTAYFSDSEDEKPLIQRKYFS